MFQFINLIPSIGSTSYGRLKVLIALGVLLHGLPHSKLGRITNVPAMHWHYDRQEESQAWGKYLISSVLFH